MPLASNAARAVLTAPLAAPPSPLPAMLMPSDPMTTGTPPRLAPVTVVAALDDVTLPPSTRAVASDVTLSMCSCPAMSRSLTADSATTTSVLPSKDCLLWLLALPVLTSPSNDVPPATVRASVMSPLVCATVTSGSTASGPWWMLAPGGGASACASGFVGYDASAMT